jgi:hypothetical protein
LWPFGICILYHLVYVLCGHLVYFPPFWYVVPRKIWQPWYMHVCKHQQQLYLPCPEARLGFFRFYIFFA